MNETEQQPQPSADSEELSETKTPDKPEALREREKALLEAYEARQKAIAQQIESLRQKVLEKRGEIKWAKATADFLEDKITIAQSKTLGKVFNFLEIQRMRQQMGVEQVKLEEAQKDFDTAVGLLKEIESQVDDRHELEEIEKLMADFYKEQEEEIKAIEKEKQVRDIGNISREHNALFVHNFWSPKAPDARGPTSVVEPGTKWQTKLKILLGLEPQICTGAVREGYSKDHPYHDTDVGVVLKGGKMRAAGVSGSRVFGGVRDEKQDIGQLEEALGHTIRKEKGYGTNEYVVEKPEVAGIFVPDNRDAFQGGYGASSENPIHSFDLAREISEEASKLGIPVYVRKAGEGMDGKFYKAQYDMRTGKLVAGEPISHEEILDNDFQVSEERRQSLREEIFEDAPFKLEALRRGGGKISESDLKHITTG